MSSQASRLLYLPPLLSENISWSPSKVWLVKLAFSKATPFFLLQPTRRICCSRHLFVPLSSSHLVLSNIFHRIFFNIQIVFFPVHFDSHINAAMNDLYDKILFSLVLSSVLISWLFRFFLLVVTIVIALRCSALPYHTADLDFKRAGRQRKRLGGRPRSSKRVVVIFQSKTDPSSRRRRNERKREPQTRKKIGNLRVPGGSKKNWGLSSLSLSRGIPPRHLPW